MRKLRTPETDENGLEEVIILARPVDPAERQGGMRLNVGMKQEIVDNAIEHAFGKKQKALDAEQLALGTAAYRKCISPARIKAAALLGEPWVHLGTDYYGKKVETYLIQFCFGGQYHNLKIPSTLPLPKHLSHDERKLFRVNDQDLVERNRTYLANQEKLNEASTKVRATLEAMLQRITTSPSLEKNWPAGLPFYKHLPKKYPFRHQVPAVLIDELNAALGI